MTSLLLCVSLLTLNVIPVESFDLNIVDFYSNIYDGEDYTPGMIYTPMGSAVNVISYHIDYSLEE